MRKLFVLFGLLIAPLVAAPIVSAAGQSQCQIIYGGGEVCPPQQVKFTINKLVQRLTKGGEFFENMTLNDLRLSPGQNVNFKIVIENTGTTDITNLNVVDTFPDQLSFVAGVGNASVGAKQISFVVGKINRGQKMEFVITAKAADAAGLPQNQAIACAVNNVRATAPDGSTAEDNAQVCIERGIVAVPTPQIFQKPTVSQIPSTGPELLGLVALIPTGLAGIYLRRKAS